MRQQARTGTNASNPLAQSITFQRKQPTETADAAKSRRPSEEILPLIALDDSPCGLWKSRNKE